MTKRLFSCMFAFLLLIPCMFLMTACANGSNNSDKDGGKNNPANSLTSAQLSTIYKQAAVDTWGKVGFSAPTASGGNADTLSVSIVDKKTEATTDLDIQLISMNAAGNAAVVYLLGELYANANFVLMNDIVKFDTTNMISDETFNYSFILSPSIDTENSKIYLEVIVDVTLPEGASASADGATPDSFEQYVYAEFDYDFTEAELTAFRFCGVAAGTYIDLGIDSENKKWIYNTTDSTDTFAVAVDAAKDSFRSSAQNIQKLTASFQTECQNYFNIITMLQTPVVSETK